MSKRSYIYEYIRERVPGRGRQIVGVIVGKVVNGQIVTGFSKTNLKAGDKFDRDYGITIALNRASGAVDSPELPPQVVGQMERFKNRCVRYFKQAQTVSVKGAYVAPVTPKNIEQEISYLFGPWGIYGEFLMLKQMGCVNGGGLKDTILKDSEKTDLRKENLETDLRKENLENKLRKEKIERIII
jgi:hypothetical protein